MVGSAGVYNVDDTRLCSLPMLGLALSWRIIELIIFLNTSTFYQWKKKQLFIKITTFCDKTDKPYKIFANRYTSVPPPATSAMARASCRCSTLTSSFSPRSWLSQFLYIQWAKKAMGSAGCLNAVSAKPLISCGQVLFSRNIVSFVQFISKSSHKRGIKISVKVSSNQIFSTLVYYSFWIRYLKTLTFF